MSERTGTVFVSNADLPIGEIISQHLLLGKHRSSFENIICGVKCRERSGNLECLGAWITEMRNRDLLMKNFQLCEVLVLVPDVASADMVKQAELLLSVAKEARVEHLIMVSRVGVEENTETSRQLKRIEDMCRESGIDPLCIVRHGVIQQRLFWFMDWIKRGQLCLPVNENAKWAPLNLDDLAMFVASLCAEVEFKKVHAKRTYRLTGPALVSGKSLAEILSKHLTGHKVVFEEIDMNRLEDHLRKWVGLNDTLIREAMDMFKLINENKFNFVSDDQQKTIGTQPITVDRFIQEYEHRFVPGHEGGMKEGLRRTL